MDSWDRGDIAPVSAGPKGQRPRLRLDTNVDGDRAEHSLVSPLSPDAADRLEDPGLRSPVSPLEPEPVDDSLMMADFLGGGYLGHDWNPLGGDRSQAALDGESPVGEALEQTTDQHSNTDSDAGSSPRDEFGVEHPSHDEMEDWAATGDGRWRPGKWWNKGKLDGDAGTVKPGTTAKPRKQVRFDPLAQVHDQDGRQTSSALGGTEPAPRPHAGQVDPSDYKFPTGENSHTLTGPPESGSHPLKASDSALTNSSYMNSQDVMRAFDSEAGRPKTGKRPGMGGALLIGDHVVPHSSMKHRSGRPNHHDVVKQVLDGAPEDLRKWPQHGKCAEVGAISDYLHNQDPNGTWTVDQAKHHFEQVGAATTAHRPRDGEPADACASCQYLTSKLGISWYTRPPWEADGSGQRVDIGAGEERTNDSSNGADRPDTDAEPSAGQTLEQTTGRPLGRGPTGDDQGPYPGAADKQEAHEDLSDDSSARFSRWESVPETDSKSLHWQWVQHPNLTDWRLVPSPSYLRHGPRIISQHSFASDANAKAYLDQHENYRYVGAVNRDNFDRRAAGHRSNCAVAAIQTANGIEHGREFTAGPSAGMLAGDMERVIGARFQVFDGGYDELIQHLDGHLGRGDQGIVYAERWDGFGHYINVHRDKDGVLTFIDGQWGRPANLSWSPRLVAFVPLEHGKVHQPVYTRLSSAGRPGGQAELPSAVHKSGGTTTKAGHGSGELEAQREHVGLGEDPTTDDSPPPDTNDGQSSPLRGPVVGRRGAGRPVRETPWIKGRLENGESVEFRADAVLNRPLYRRPAGAHGGDELVGLSLTNDHDYKLDQTFLDSRSKVDTMRMTGPGERLAEASRLNRDVVPTPWAASYDHSGKGPIYVIGHGKANGFSVRLPAGSVLRDGRMLGQATGAMVAGEEMGRLLPELEWFRHAYAANPKGDLAVLSCQVGQGPAHGLMRELRTRPDSPYNNPAHFAMSNVGRRGKTDSKTPLSLGEFGVSDNKGWISYRRGSLDYSEQSYSKYPETWRGSHGFISPDHPAGSYGSLDDPIITGKTTDTGEPVRFRASTVFSRPIRGPENAAGRRPVVGVSFRKELSGSEYIGGLSRMDDPDLHRMYRTLPGDTADGATRRGDALAPTPWNGRTLLVGMGAENRVGDFVLRKGTVLPNGVELDRDLTAHVDKNEDVAWIVHASKYFQKAYADNPGGHLVGTTHSAGADHASREFMDEMRELGYGNPAHFAKDKFLVYRPRSSRDVRPSGVLVNNNAGFLTYDKASRDPHDSPGTTYSDHEVQAIRERESLSGRIGRGLGRLFAGTTERSAPRVHTDAGGDGREPFLSGPVHGRRGAGQPRQEQRSPESPDELVTLSGQHLETAPPRRDSGDGPAPHDAVIDRADHNDDPATALAAQVGRLLSARRVSLSELFHALRQVDGSPRSARMLEEAFERVHGRTLADALNSAIRSGSLRERDYERSLEMLGYVNHILGDDREVPARLPGALRLDEEPRHAPEAVSYADRIGRAVRERDLDSALTVLDRTRRDPRGLWAVEDAYRERQGRDLRQDLITLRPDDQAFTEQVLGAVSEEPVSESHADYLFDVLRNSWFEDEERGAVRVPVDYPDEGCYARAHLWSLKLMQMGVQPYKLFVGRDNPLLSVETPYSAHATHDLPGTVQWQYHVVPAIKVRNDQGVRWFALDPNVADRAMRVEEYLARHLGVGEDGYRYFEGNLGDVRRALSDDFETHRQSYTTDDGILFPEGQAVVVVTEPRARDWLDLFSDRAEPSVRDLDRLVGYSNQRELAEHSEEVGRRAVMRRVYDSVWTLASAELANEPERLLAEIRDIASSEPYAKGLLREKPEFAQYLRFWLGDRYPEAETLFADQSAGEHEWEPFPDITTGADTEGGFSAFDTNEAHFGAADPDLDAGLFGHDATGDARFAPAPEWAQSAAEPVHLWGPVVGRWGGVGDVRLGGGRPGHESVSLVGRLEARAAELERSSDHAGAAEFRGQAQRLAESGSRFEPGQSVSRRSFLDENDESAYIAEHRQLRFLPGVNGAKLARGEAGHTRNCFNAAVAGARSLRTRTTVAARAGDATLTDDAAPYLTRRFSGYDLRWGSRAGIDEYMRGQRAGAQGMVFLDSLRGGQDGHWALVHKDSGGVIHYVDPHSGRMEDPEGWEAIGFSPLRPNLTTHVADLASRIGRGLGRFFPGTMVRSTRSVLPDVGGDGREPRVDRPDSFPRTEPVVSLPRRERTDDPDVLEQPAETGRPTPPDESHESLDGPSTLSGEHSETTPIAERSGAADRGWDAGDVLALPEQNGELASVLAQRVGGLLSEPRISLPELFHALRWVDRSPRNTRLLEETFERVHGRTLADALDDAWESGSLRERDYERSLEMLGYVNHILGDDREVPERLPGALRLDEEPRHAPEAVSYADRIDRAVREGDLDSALTVLDRVRRDPRGLWAVEDAYRERQGRDLRQDLITLKPDDQAFTEQVLGSVSKEPVSEPHADYLFDVLRNSWFEDEERGAVRVPVDYPDEGCYARAHLWSLKLMQLGVEPHKLFVGRDDPSLSVKTPYAKKATHNKPGKVKWSFHVFPAIKVRTDQGVRWFALDPSVADRTMPVEEYLARHLRLDQGSYRYFEGDLGHIQQTMRDELSTSDDDRPFPKGQAVVVVTEPRARAWGDLFPAYARPSMRDVDRVDGYSYQLELAMHSEEAGRRAVIRRTTESISAAESGSASDRSALLLADLRDIASSEPYAKGLLRWDPASARRLRFWLGDRYPEAEALFAEPVAERPVSVDGDIDLPVVRPERQQSPDTVVGKDDESYSDDSDELSLETEAEEAGRGEVMRRISDSMLELASRGVADEPELLLAELRDIASSEPYAKGFLEAKPAIAQYLRFWLGDRYPEAEALFAEPVGERPVSADAAVDSPVVPPERARSAHGAATQAGQHLADTRGPVVGRRGAGRPGRPWIKVLLDHDELVEVRPDAIVNRPLYQRVGEHGEDELVGFTLYGTLHDEHENHQRFMDARANVDKMWMTGPGEDLFDAFLMDRDVVPTPWAASYDHGGKGPIHIFDHGDGGGRRFFVSLKAGSVLRDGRTLDQETGGTVVGEEMGRLLPELKWFQRAYAVNPDGDFAIYSCNVGKDAAHGLMRELRTRPDSPYDNPAYFALGTLITNGDPDLGARVPIGEFAVSDNRGFIAYDRGSLSSQKLSYTTYPEISRGSRRFIPPDHPAASGRAWDDPMITGKAASGTQMTFRASAVLSQPIWGAEDASGHRPIVGVSFPKPQSRRDSHASVEDGIASASVLDQSDLRSLYRTLPGDSTDGATRRREALVQSPWDGRPLLIGMGVSKDRSGDFVVPKGTVVFDGYVLKSDTIVRVDNPRDRAWILRGSKYFQMAYRENPDGDFVSTAHSAGVSHASERFVDELRDIGYRNAAHFANDKFRLYRPRTPGTRPSGVLVDNNEGFLTYDRDSREPYDDLDTTYSDREAETILARESGRRAGWDAAEATAQGDGEGSARGGGSGLPMRGPRGPVVGRRGGASPWSPWRGDGGGRHGDGRPGDESNSLARRLDDRAAELERSSDHSDQARAADFRQQVRRLSESGPRFEPGQSVSRRNFLDADDESAYIAGHSRLRYLAGVNAPKLARHERGHTRNCFNATVAGARSLRTRTTVPARVGDATWTAAAARYLSRRFSGYDLRWRSREEIDEYMRGRHAGAQGILYLGHVRETEDGHWALVHKGSDGVIHYVDPQSGRMEDPEGWQAVGFSPLRPNLVTHMEDLAGLIGRGLGRFFPRMMVRSARSLSSDVGDGPEVGLDWPAPSSRAESVVSLPRPEKTEEPGAVAQPAETRGPTPPTPPHESPEGPVPQAGQHPETVPVVESGGRDAAAGGREQPWIEGQLDSGERVEFRPDAIVHRPLYRRAVGGHGDDELVGLSFGNDREHKMDQIFLDSRSKIDTMRLTGPDENLAEAFYLDRDVVPTPWAASYDHGKGPIHIIGHGRSDGFIVLLKAGSVLKDGGTLDHTTQAMITGRRMGIALPELEWFQRAYAVNSEGDFALYQCNVGERAAYGLIRTLRNRPDSPYHNPAHFGMGLVSHHGDVEPRFPDSTGELGVWHNKGWITFDRSALSPRKLSYTRYPEISRGSHKFIAPDHSQASIGSLDDPIITGKRTDTDTPVRFRASSVFSRPIRGHLDASGRSPIVGVSFDDDLNSPEPIGGLRKLDHPDVRSMYRTLPGDSTDAAMRRGEALVRTPWDGRTVLIGMGAEDRFGDFMVPGGTVLPTGYKVPSDMNVRVEKNQDVAWIVHASEAFQEAYADNPDGHLVGTMDSVGSGDAALEFMDEMRDLGYRNAAHFAKDELRVYWPRNPRDIRRTGVFVDNNAGFLTYDKGSWQPQDNLDTTYSDHEVQAIRKRESSLAWRIGRGLGRFFPRVMVRSARPALSDSGSDRDGLRPGAWPARLSGSVFGRRGAGPADRERQWISGRLDNGERVEFRPDAIVNRPLYRQGAGEHGDDELAGFTLHDEFDHSRAQTFLESRAKIDTMRLTGPDENLAEAFQTDRDVVPAPWAASYDHGGKGPIHIFDHGRDGGRGFNARLKPGTVLRDGRTLDQVTRATVTGEGIGRALPELEWFRRAYAANPDGDFAVYVCDVGQHAAHGLIQELRTRPDSPYHNPAHFPLDEVITSDMPEVATPPLGEFAVSDNKGWITYDRDSLAGQKPSYTTYPEISRGSHRFILPDDQQTSRQSLDDPIITGKFGPRDSMSVKFRASDVLSRPILGPEDATGHRPVIGVSFPESEVRDDLVEPDSESLVESDHEDLDEPFDEEIADVSVLDDRDLSGVYRTLPGDSTDAATGRDEALVRAPWEGRPLLVGTGVSEGRFGDFVLPKGTVLPDGFKVSKDLPVHVESDDVAWIVHASKYFQKAYADNPDGHLVGIMNSAGADHASQEFMDEMRQLGYGSAAHFANDNFRLYRPDSGDVRPSGVLVDNNAGFLTYGKDSRTPHDSPGTTYTDHEVQTIRAQESSLAPDTSNQEPLLAGMTATNLSGPVRGRRGAGPQGREKPWIKGYLESGESVEFRADAVVIRPLYRRAAGAHGDDELVGFSWFNESQHEHHQMFVASRPRIDTMRMTGPEEKLTEAFHLDRDVVPTPWAASYDHGGQGPIIMSGHGSTHRFAILLEAGSVLKDGRTLDETTGARVTGNEMGRLLPESDWFQRAYARNPNGDFAVYSCRVGPGAAYDLIQELRNRPDSPYNNPAHFAMGTMGFTGMPNPLIPVGEFGVFDNKGWISYRRGSRDSQRQPYATYPETLRASHAFISPDHQAGSRAALDDPIITGKRTGTGKPVRFRASSVYSQPVFGRADAAGKWPIVGVSFHDDFNEPEQIGELSRMNDPDLSKMYRTLPGDSADAATRRSEALASAPWNGRALLIGMGARDRVGDFILTGGTVLPNGHKLPGDLKVRVEKNEDIAWILHASEYFQKAYADNPDGHLVGTMNSAGADHASREFMEEMRDLGYRNAAHFAKGSFLVYRPGNPRDTRPVGALVNNNAGFLTYDKGSWKSHDNPDTVYSDHEVQAIRKRESSLAWRIGRGLGRFFPRALVRPARPVFSHAGGHSHGSGLDWPAGSPHNNSALSVPHPEKTEEPSTVASSAEEPTHLTLSGPVGDRRGAGRPVADRPGSDRSGDGESSPDPLRRDFAPNDSDSREHDPQALLDRARLARPKVIGKIDAARTRSKILDLLGNPDEHSTLARMVQAEFSDDRQTKNWLQHRKGFGAREDSGPQVAVRAVGLGSAREERGGEGKFDHDWSGPTVKRGASSKRAGTGGSFMARLWALYVMVQAEVFGVVNPRGASLSASTKHEVTSKVTESDVPSVTSKHNVGYEISVATPGRWPWSKTTSRTDYVAEDVELEWPDRPQPDPAVEHGLDLSRDDLDAIEHVEFSQRGDARNAVGGVLHDEREAEQLLGWLGSLDKNALAEPVRKTFNFAEHGTTEVMVAVAKPVEGGKARPIVVRELPDEKGTITHTAGDGAEAGATVSVDHQHGFGLHVLVGHATDPLTGWAVGPTGKKVISGKDDDGNTERQQRQSTETYNGGLAKRQADLSLVVTMRNPTKRPVVRFHEDTGLHVLTKSRHLPPRWVLRVPTTATWWSRIPAADQTVKDILKDTATDTTKDAVTDAVTNTAENAAPRTPTAPKGIDPARVPDRIDARYRLSDETAQAVVGRIMSKLAAPDLLPVRGARAHFIPFADRVLDTLNSKEATPNDAATGET
ncbi:MAG TPA: protein-glutamine glutaminase family protein, partial [Pseudonocardiaceae bacterium]